MLNFQIFFLMFKTSENYKIFIKQSHVNEF